MERSENYWSVLNSTVIGECKRYNIALSSLTQALPLLRNPSNVMRAQSALNTEIKVSLLIHEKDCAASKSDRTVLRRFPMFHHIRKHSAAWTTSPSSHLLPNVIYYLTHFNSITAWLFYCEHLVTAGVKTYDCPVSIYVTLP